MFYAVFFERFFVLVEETVPALLMGLMVALIFADASGRYILNRPLQGAGELATLLFVWQVFLGAAGALRRHLHVGIEYFVQMLPIRGRLVVQLGVYVLLLATVLVIAKLGWDLTLASSNRLKPVVNVPYTYIYLAVPLSFGLMAIHLFSSFVRSWRALIGGFPSYQEVNLDFGLEEVKEVDIER